VGFGEAVSTNPTTPRPTTLVVVTDNPFIPDALIPYADNIEGRVTKGVRS